MAKEQPYKYDDDGRAIVKVGCRVNVNGVVHVAGQEIKTLRKNTVKQEAEDGVSE